MSLTRGKPNAPSDTDLVEDALCNLKGQVSVVQDSYGFITTEHPVRATVFAHWSTILNPRMNSGRKFGLKQGDNVLLDIKRSPPQFKARYQAVHVRLLESEVDIKQYSHPTVSATHQENGKISNQEGTIDSVHQNGGTVIFGKDNEERVTFHRRSIPETLVRPKEKVSDIFPVGSKVCFDACLVTDGATGTTQWQATLVTTVMKEKFSKVFDIDLVAPVSESHSTKSDRSTVPILVPFTSDPRLPLYPSSWSPASSAFQPYQSQIVTAASYTSGRECPLSGVCREQSNIDQTFNSRHTSVPSLIAAMNRTIAVTDRRSVKDKPAVVVPPSAETQRAPSNGLWSTEPDTTAPADERPLPASHYRPPKAKSPERAFTESAPSIIDPRYIGPATSTAGKQLAPQASNVKLATSVQKQPAAALPTKPEAGSQYDAVQQKELNVDSTPVNNSDKDNTIKRNSASTAPHAKSPECLVSVHNDVRGVVMRVHERSAIVCVEQGGLTNYTEVQAFSFYKDGTLVEDDLRHVLREGDEVTMDFMSGSTGCNLMTHCNMVWQGVKPRGVECVSRESFQSTLEALMAMKVPPPGASIHSSDPNVQSVENSRIIEPEQPCLEVAESCDTDKGVGEDQEELAKATAQFVVKCLRDVIHEEVQALRREFFGDLGVSSEEVNTSSDSHGASTEGSRMAPPTGHPHIRSDESHPSAAGARQLGLQDLNENDLKIISSLISEGTDAILTELRRLRLHPWSLVVTM